MKRKCIVVIMDGNEMEDYTTPLHMLTLLEHKIDSLASEVQDYGTFDG